MSPWYKDDLPGTSMTGYCGYEAVGDGRSIRRLTIAEAGARLSAIV